MRQTFNNLTVALLVFGFIAVGGVAIALGQDKDGQMEKEYRPLTRKLPAVDKVELFKLKLSYGQWDKEFEGTKTVKGGKAKKIAALWRSQTYKPYQSACHNPVYGIKFYSGDKLIVFATVCWDCNTMGFEEPYINSTQYFDGTNKKGQQLLKIFQDAFPEKN